MWEHRWQSQNLHQHIQQVAEDINFRRILMTRAETPTFKGPIGLGFKKMYNISDYSHHGSQRDATAWPEETWCLGTCWTRQHMGMGDVLGTDRIATKPQTYHLCWWEREKASTEWQQAAKPQNLWDSHRKAGNTSYRHEVHCWQGLIQHLFKRETLCTQIWLSFHDMTGSKGVSHPPSHGLQKTH